MLDRKTPSEDFRKLLTNRIRSASGHEPIDTQAFFRDKALSGLTSQYGVEGKVWTPNLSGSLNGLLIGGYGDPDVPYGAGPTRPVNHATYAVRVIDTAEQVPLIEGITRKPAEGLRALMYLLNGFLTEDDIKELNRRFEEQRKYEKDGYKNPFVVASKKGIKVDGMPTYLEMQVANVNNQRFKYQGNVILYLVRQLGSGLNYMKEDEYYGKVEGSRRTDDILAERTPIATPLRDAVERHVKDLGKLCNIFERPLSANAQKQRQVMLTVDNV